MPFKGLFTIMLLMLQVLAYGQMRLDSTFGANGVVKISLDDYNEAVQVIRLDNDSLLLLANLTPIDTVVNTDFALIKLTPQGSVDSTYGTNGSVRYHFYKKEVSNARSFVRLTNGQVMVLGSGYSHAMPAYLPACLMRLNANGSIDSTFGHSGTLDVQFAGIQEFPTVLKQLSTGKLVLGGYTIDSSDTHSEEPVVARMDVDGNMDTAFGIQGRAYLKFAAGFINARHLIGGLLYDVLELPDSSLIVSGGYSNVYNLVSCMMRILPSGKIDTDFINKGYFAANFTPLYNSQILKMARANDGKVWFAASSNAIQDRDFYIGNLDLTNNANNTSAADFQANEDVLADMLLDENGNPIMVGKSINPIHNHTGYVSDYFAIDQQPATNFPFADQKFIFSDDTTMQCGAISAVLQSHNRVVCYGFQNRPNNTSQLMLIAAKVSTTLAVEETVLNENELTVYPNPATTSLHLQIPNNIQNARFAVYNCLGEKMIEQSISSNEVIIVNGWANGLYFVQVNGDGLSAQAKFVKE